MSLILSIQCDAAVSGLIKRTNKDREAEHPCQVPQRSVKLSDVTPLEVTAYRILSKR